MAYNGWTNHETWNFMRWHSDQLQAHVLSYLEMFKEYSDSEFADDLYFWSYDMCGLAELPLGFVRECAHFKFDKINFHEIVAHMREVIKAIEEAFA